jgi:hypothetical protein
MTSSTRIQLLSFAAATALVALTATSVPARSDERPVRLGPVGALEPIMTTVGDKNVIAFYRPGDGHCNIYVVLNDSTDASDHSATQVRVSLSPRQIVHLDIADSDTLNLKCGNDAETLAIVDEHERTVFGSSILKAILRLHRVSK